MSQIRWVQRARASRDNQSRFEDELPTSLPSGVNSMLGTILLVILVLLLIGALPSWPHSASWGYAPSGGLGLVLLVVVVLLLMGRI